MTDGDHGSGIDWKRRFLSSSNKASSKAKTFAGASPATSKSTTSRTLSSPSSFANLASPTGIKTTESEGGGSSHVKESTTKDGDGGLQRRSSTPGGSRSNVLWSGRGRQDSIREEEELGEKMPTSAPAGRKANGVVDAQNERGKTATVESDDGEQRLRKSSGSRRRSPPPKTTSSRGSMDVNSGDEGSEREGKRGSMIGKVRGKFTLPLMRPRENGPGDRAESPGGKSSGGGQSVNHAQRPSADMIQGGRTRPESPLASNAPNKHKRLPTPLSIRSNDDGSASTDDAGKTLTENLSPKRAVSGGSSSADAASQPGGSNEAVESQDTLIPRSGIVKRSNKIIDLSTSDLNIPEPTTTTSEASTTSTTSTTTTKAAAALKSPSLLSPPTPATAKRQASMNSIKESRGTEVRPGVTETTTPTANRSSSTRTSTQTHSSVDKPSTALRSTSALKINSISSTAASSMTTLKPSNVSPKTQRERKAPTTEPPMPEVDPDEVDDDNINNNNNDDDDEKPPSVPASGMYWSQAPCYGYDHNALRAHTATLVGSNIYVFGGCDSQACFNDMYIFDADCMQWTRPSCTGDIPPTLRAMTATAVGKKIVLFGGGDGPAYYNDVYIFDTTSRRFTKPVITSSHLPSIRRAHTACLYNKHHIYIFGGGDGFKALNDVWRLDVQDMTKPSWKLISAESSSSTKDPSRPTARGYHTANMVGTKLIIFGGSDGQECFRDVWVFKVDSETWHHVKIEMSFPRLSHTATIIGSYLFVVGGHDGVEYSSDVLLLNLVTMQWDKRKVYGNGPSGRGYHATVLYDSRLFVIGGFDG
ncbi:MAG: hypothetical protein M1823_003740 [Watsoniomyces obsoletus]|nr:MAG: hypothetical protein M1823_003740 [Watsoniomyces obsoletus]